MNILNDLADFLRARIEEDGAREGEAEILGRVESEQQYTRPEIVNGTGWPKRARFVMVSTGE